MKLKHLPVVVVALIALVAPSTPALAFTSKDVEKELMCQCGCTMVVDVCDCGTAEQIREKIAGMMSQGQGKNQIVAYFVEQYGEKMLAYPAKKGFNLIAWILPFAAVVAGGTGLFFLLRAWALKGRGGATEPAARLQTVSEDETEEYRGRLEEELKLYREEGSI